MTLKNVFSEMERYNDISVVTGNEELKFYFTDFFTYEFYSYHGFEMWIKENYIDEVVDVVLNGDYEFYAMLGSGECDLRFVFDKRETIITLNISL